MLTAYTLPLSIGPASSQPLILPNGISSAASYAPEAPIAPGSLVNIYGSRLADQDGSSPSLPLLTQIADTRVLLANKELPLLFVSPDRIIAQVPFESGINTEQQLVVQKGSTQSAPEALVVAPAQPAVFTVNQQGTGQAVVTVGNTSVLADVAHSVKAGDMIVIYCSGLGSVSPRTETGNAAPVNPLSRTAVPVVMIGGKSAPVLFSGLVPAFVGLYQVNAVVPNGILPGTTVPILLSVLGQTSPPVTIAVQ